MRLLFIADGRSPIALNWIEYFTAVGHEVHLLSTFDCEVDLPLESLSFVSVAFSGQAGSMSGSVSGRASRKAQLIGVRTAIRHWLGPFTIRSAARQVQARIEAIEPDLIHAMRIPFEGMLAAAINHPAPLLVSVWGNDFTLHAPASPWMRNLTYRTLMSTDGLHVDCYRDRKLAFEWGLHEGCPVLVSPGAGGVRSEIFHSDHSLPSPHPDRRSVGIEEIPEDAFVIVNPRGFRAYVRNDTFFKAIPGILAQKPKTFFICPAMQDERKAQAWVEKLKIGHAVRLLPKLTPHEMASVFRRAQITLSLTEHDGTPNTLLEAMACGSLPIAGDLESIREWIKDGVNGYLVDPGDSDRVAKVVLDAMAASEFTERARTENIKIVAERATYKDVMSQAEHFYNRLLGEEHE